MLNLNGCHQKHGAANTHGWKETKMTDPIKTAREALECESAALKYIRHALIGNDPPDIDRAMMHVSCQMDRIDTALAALDQVQNVGVDVDALQKEYAAQYFYPRSKLVASEVVRNLAAKGHLQTPVKGWKLVPVEPTFEMIDAWNSKVKYYDTFFEVENYKAMLDAAPEREG
jgi:hypothetical protein